MDDRRAAALVLSSHVAADRIGGGAQALVLAGRGFDPVHVPTVLFGRSPARGGRGWVVDPDRFAEQLDDVLAARPEGFALVLTGHFSHPDQVMAAADAVQRLRAGGASPLVLVDPVLGDAPRGLYVKPEVAQAVAGALVPVADWITPNLWELSFLSGREPASPAEVVDAVRALGRPALVTSAPAGDGEVGLICASPAGARLWAHPRAPQAPNGTGDLAAALFACGLARSLTPFDAAAAAAERVAGLVGLAYERGMDNLPVLEPFPTAPLRMESLT